MALLFHAIRQNPGVSQGGLRNLTPVDRSTISTVVHQLEADGLLKRSRGKQSYGMGRPEDQLEIEPLAGILVGLALRRDGRLSIVGAGVDGLVHVALDIDGVVTEATLPDRLDQHVQAIRARMPDPAVPIRGVGLLLEGPRSLKLDSRAGPDRQALARIEHVVGCAVTIAHDVHAFTIAERFHSTGGDLDDFLYVHGGAIVRGAPFLSGRLHHGISGLTQRFGHMIVEPNGRPAEFGGQGSLNAYLSRPAILGRLAEFGVRARTLEDAVGAARVNEALVRTVLSEAGSYLGVAVANALNLLDIGTVILGGELVPLFDYLKPAIRQMIERDVVDPLGREAIVRPSVLGREPIAEGAVALAMESFLPLA